MIKIIQPQELENLGEENSFVGELPVMTDAVITFKGKGNILFCEKGVHLKKTKLTFHGDGCVIYLSESYTHYSLKVDIYNNSVFFVGKNNYFNGVLNAVVSERKHIFIGNGGLISFGIWLRNSDSHLVYDMNTGDRINNSRSIFVGDHVWLGQDIKLLKGTHVHSGSIVGAGAVVAGKRIFSNSSWVGNPAKEISTSVFWDGACVNAYSEKKTEESQAFCDEKHIYKFKEKEYIGFEGIDLQLTQAESAEVRLQCLKALVGRKDKNRFAFIKEKSEKAETLDIKEINVKTVKKKKSLLKRLIKKLIVKIKAWV